MYYDVVRSRELVNSVSKENFACELAVTGTFTVKLPIGIGHTGLDFCGVRKTFV